jgi:hypothetical protein
MGFRSFRAVTVGALPMFPRAFYAYLRLWETVLTGY